MTLEQLKAINLSGKNVLILGRAGAGKTHLAKILSFPPHVMLNTDSYLTIPGEMRQIQALIEDAYHFGLTIIEGCLGYGLLLEGHRQQNYHPDIIIDISIPRGKQYQIYMEMRDPQKIKHLKWAHEKNLSILNEYHRICPESEKPLFITLENIY